MATRIETDSFGKIEVDDSRYWGFVPDDHIRGKAFFIWFNWADISSLAFKRVGSGIH